MEGLEYGEVVGSTILTTSELALMLEKIENAETCLQRLRQAIGDGKGTMLLMHLYTSVDTNTHSVGDVLQTAVKSRALEMAQEQER